MNTNNPNRSSYSVEEIARVMRVNPNRAAAMLNDAGARPTIRTQISGRNTPVARPTVMELQARHQRDDWGAQLDGLLFDDN